MPPKRAAQVAGAQVAGEVAGGQQVAGGRQEDAGGQVDAGHGRRQGNRAAAAAKAAAPAAAAAKVAELKAKAMALKAKAVKLVAGWKPLDWALFALCVLTALGAIYFAPAECRRSRSSPPPKVGVLSGKAFDPQSKTLAKRNWAPPSSRHVRRRAAAN